METPRDEFLDLNGLRHHYLDWGRPAGTGGEVPTLVMVHGLTRQAHYFDDLAARLCGRFRCLALDVRGRGQSAWGPPESYSFAQYAADLGAFLEALGIARCHYIGSSMGGQIGMTFAAERPATFLSFTLNDIGPAQNAAGSSRIQERTASTPKALPSLDALLDRERSRLPQLAGKSRAELEAQYRWDVHHNPDGTVRYHYDPEIVRGRLVGPGAEAARETMWRGFRALACPVLLLRGAETDLLGLETVAAMRQAQPAMTVVEVPGVGHAPEMGDPRVQAAFRAFYGE
ncbi:MAG: alpha/beta hydrolase [Candidatus Lambdaproteobacteria bacterium]|nr:alpha/beta hydrolase [Candidatus Lambdaproteobacteria bacterium]